MAGKTNKKLREETIKVLKESEIKKEVTRLKKLYKELGKDKIKFLEGIINEAAFMKITLEETRTTLLEEGMTEIFEQGKQKFKRNNPSVDIYTTFINRYSNVMKQLIDLLPKQEKKTENDALMAFLNKGVNK